MFIVNSWDQKNVQEMDTYPECSTILYRALSSMVQGSKKIMFIHHHTSLIAVHALSTARIADL